MSLYKGNWRYQARFLFGIVILWVFALTLFTVVRHLEFSSFEIINTIGFGKLPLINQLGMILPAAIIFGLLFGVFEVFVFPRINLGEIPMLKAIFKSLFYTAIVMFVGYMTYRRATLEGSQDTSQFSSFIQSEGFLGLTIYVFAFSIIINLIIQTIRVMGPGFIPEIVTGKYKIPKEELRVMMFLDLNNSTGLSEEIGHAKMSQLMQDTFGNLSPLVESFKGELYQFAGDEAVISWKTPGSSIQPYFLDFYFNYINNLEKKQKYFLDTHGVIPSFKAGLHFGRVTISQIDGYRTQKAFFGDVLNTAARIRSSCKDLEREILISEDLYKIIESSDKYRFEDMGEAQFRGKKSYTRIYAVFQDNQ